MSPEEFRKILIIIGVVMTMWAFAAPVLLMITLYSIGYQHDYELKEPQWTIPGLVEWFFVPKGTDTHEKQESLWSYQRRYDQETPLPVLRQQDLPLEDEVLQVPARMAPSHDSQPGK